MLTAVIGKLAYMDTPGDRIKRARTEEGLTQQELADAAGVSRSAVAQWEGGDTKALKPDNLFKIAKRLNRSAEWLATGKGVSEINEPPKLYDRSILRPIGIHGGRKIPVLNYVQAGNPREAVDAYQPGAGMEFLILDDEISQEAGPHTYALIIDGESMTPDFRPGDRVIIDPDVKPRPGDYVVAKIAGSQEVTFKRYRSRGNDTEGREIFELAPINQDYATIVVDGNNPGEIIGTMIEHRHKRRK